jgi:trehalose 2-sulfotransferase
MGWNYIIATTARTGSFLLCEGLAATGIAGVPQEYGSLEDIETWRDFCGCSNHAEYFFRFSDLCRTPNGVFGAKFMWLQFVSWGHEARQYLRSDRSTPDLLRTVVGPFRVIRLIRRDIVRQAISWVRAQASGEWSRGRTASVCTTNVRITDYDSDVLQRAVRLLQRYNRDWEAGLALFGAPVLNVFYEDLSTAYPETIARVLDFCGLDWNGELRAPVLTRQADAITEEWLERAKTDLDLGFEIAPLDGVRSQEL